MRTAFYVAALAAGALAVPYKRDVYYTDWDIVYVTDTVTVTAGQAPPADTPAAEPTSTSVAFAQHYGHFGHHDHESVWTSAWATTWTEAPAQPTTTSTPVAAYTPPPSSTPTPEPEPETSSTPAPSPVPATTSTSAAAWNIPLTSLVPQVTSSYVAPQSSAAPSGSSSSGPMDDPVYGAAVLAQHNLHRSNHSSPPVGWEHDLYVIAKATAQTCVYKHNTTAGGGGYGQNIAAGVARSDIASVITDMFYNGEEPIFAADGCYGEANPDMSNFDSWGHFTQVVWKDTTTVACYTTDEDDCSKLYDSNGNPLASDIPAYFTVCNYKSPGNFAGEYADNVGKPLGQAPSYASS